MLNSIESGGGAIQEAVMIREHALSVIADQKTNNFHAEAAQFSLALEMSRNGRMSALAQLLKAVGAVMIGLRSMGHSFEAETRRGFSIPTQAEHLFTTPQSIEQTSSQKFVL